MEITAGQSSFSDDVKIVFKFGELNSSISDVHPMTKPKLISKRRRKIESRGFRQGLNLYEQIDQANLLFLKSERAAHAPQTSNINTDSSKIG